MNELLTTRARWSAVAAACLTLAARALGGGFVYETPAELVTTGDFDGDGLTDIVVVDRATGNARVGYQSSAGAISWMAAVPTGVPSPTAIAAGRFFVPGREALAVTSPGFNYIKFVELSPATNRSTFAPNGVGPDLLIGLRNPQGSIDTPPFDWVATGSRGSDPGITILDLFGFLGDGVSFLGESGVAQPYLASGNALHLAGIPATLGAVMQRGSNDTFAIYSFTNANQFALGRSDLAPGTEYVFGRFNNESQPRFLFYVPGQSKVMVQSLVTNSGALAFGPAIVNIQTAAVQRVFYVDEGSNGLAMLQFSSGLVGARVSAGGALLEAYRFGAGTGFAASAVVSLGNTRFALLSAHTNDSGSARSETFERSGTNYNSISSSNLPPKSTDGTRANVWLFAGEPFVNSQPGLISSLNGGDWVASLTGLPGAINVVAETDRGTSLGLGNPASTPLGASPGGTTHGIVNQYHEAISLFSYSSTRAAEAIRITISPPPGTYASSVQVSFTTAPAGNVFYYTGSGLYQTYSTPFTVGTNTTIQFYGVNTGTSQRSSLQTASYTIIGGGTPPLVTTNGTGTNSIPPVETVTNGIPTYGFGTIVYGRRNGAVGTVWMINLDGTDDHFVTTGVRPRLSPNGRHLAFLRDGPNPFAGRGNLWVRDLLTGAETLLFVNPDVIQAYDWEYGTSNLFLDYSCNLWRITFAGTMTPLPIPTDCLDDVPVRNPIDGSLAFHNLNGNTNFSGLFLAGPDATTKQRLNVNLPGGSWLNWSPGGDLLSAVNGNNSFTLDFGKDLYVVDPNADGLYQITGFSGQDGFPHGAVWTPFGDALVGAAQILNTNGIWIVVLTPDRHACGSPPVRLPTTPGDAIDFVGNVFVPPPPPRLFIRRDAAGVTVYWRRSVVPHVLQVASDIHQPANWSPVSGPFSAVGDFFEHFVPNGLLAQGAFFRLQTP